MPQASPTLTKALYRRFIALGRSLVYDNPQFYRRHARLAPMGAPLDLSTRERYTMPQACDRKAMTAIGLTIEDVVRAEFRAKATGAANAQSHVVDSHFVIGLRTLHMLERAFQLRPRPAEAAAPPVDAGQEKARYADLRRELPWESRVAYSVVRMSNERLVRPEGKARLVAGRRERGKALPGEVVRDVVWTQIEALLRERGIYLPVYGP